MWLLRSAQQIDQGCREDGERHQQRRAAQQPAPPAPKPRLRHGGRIGNCELKSTICAHQRDALPEEDRTLLILRIDRELSFDSIALAFSDAPEMMTDQERKRESARLRKRFEIVKKRLAAQIREAVAF